MRPCPIPSATEDPSDFDRAARARSAGEAVDPALHLLPQFLRRALDMGFAVGGVVELVSPDRAFGFFGETAAGVNEMVGVGIFRRGYGDQLRAQSAQRVHLLLRLVVRHDDDRAIAERIGDKRDADPGIARGAFNHSSTRL